MAEVLSVTMTGWKDVQRMLRVIPGRAEVEGVELTKKLAQSIARRARFLVGPEKTGTGRLKKSIKAIKTDNGYKVVAGEGAVNNGVNYARFQEYGYKPHWVRKKLLNKNSRLFKELNVGGIRGSDSIFVKRWTPFMTPAYYYVLNRMHLELRKTAKKIVRG